MYFCGNCGKVFKTGKFWEDDSDIYEEVCPECGCYPPDNFWFWLRHLPSLMKIRARYRKERKEFLKNRRLSGYNKGENNLRKEE